MPVADKKGTDDCIVLSSLALICAISRLEPVCESELVRCVRIKGYTSGSLATDLRVEGDYASSGAPHMYGTDTGLVCVDEQTPATRCSEIL